MPGSKANWDCASSTCAAWPKRKWKCSGPASPTICNSGSDCASCKSHPPPVKTKRRDRSREAPYANPTTLPLSHLHSTLALLLGHGKWFFHSFAFREGASRQPTPLDSALGSSSFAWTEPPTLFHHTQL